MLVCLTQALTSTYEGRLFGLFDKLRSLQPQNLLNHNTSCCTLGAIGKSLTIKDVMNWFQMFQPMAEKLLNIEQNFHWKLI
jgi:hypothetical protein